MTFSPARHGALLCALAIAGCTSTIDSPTQRADVFIVERGNLSIRVTEQGEIKPKQSTRIKNEMEGQSTIIYLIEEGVFVEKGTKLVELDASDLLERKAQQGITLHRAEAARTSAEKELDIRTKEYEAEKLGGENQVRIAELDYGKFLGKENEDGTSDMGEREQQLIEAQANIQLAEQEVKLAKNKLDWSVKLHKKGFITKEELERDQLDHQRQQKNLRVARNELNILTKFTHVKELIRLEQDIREAKTDLEGIIARGQARLAQADADLIAKRKEYDLALERYQNLEQQIESAIIHAPTPGLVVYYAESSGRGREEFVEEGATVRERQTLIELPDISQMTAELKIHEADIDKVQNGQRCLIKVDTYPDREFQGYVSRVSPVADSGSRWSNNTLKVYKTEVSLVGDRLNLKPGMSSSVTIIVAELEDVLFVPKQAVHLQGAVPYVWLDTPDGPEARPVELGISDFQFVEIDQGLNEGDRVFLATPPEVIDPEFEQPEAAPAAEIPQSVTTKSDDQGQGDEPERREAPGSSAFTEAAAKMQKILERKYPDLAEVAKKDRRAWFTNADLRQAVEDDDELREARDAMMEKMRSSGGRSGRGREGREGR